MLKNFNIEKGSGKNLIGNPKDRAMTKLVAGPAIATFNLPHF